MISELVGQNVESSYGKFAEACIAQKNQSINGSMDHVLDLRHYEAKDLASVPQRALRLSSGCDNTIGHAAIQPGCSVVDLGCGGGLDIILAAHKVGEEGRVLGIDIAPEMIEQAKMAVVEAGLENRNIYFRTANIENFYLPASYANVLISNSVLYQCHDKETVYRNIFRILRSGGILYVSDTVLTEEIDPSLREHLQFSGISCLEDAISEEDHRRILKKLCYLDIQVLDRHFLSTEELESMASSPGNNSVSPLSREDLLHLKGKVAGITITAMRQPAT